MPPPTVKLSMSIYFYKKLLSFLLSFFWQIYVLFLLRFQLEKADKACSACFFFFFWLKDEHLMEKLGSNGRIIILYKFALSYFYFNRKFKDFGLFPSQK